METGFDRQAMLPHIAEPRPEDLPLDVEYAVRPDYYNANLRQLAEAIGVVLFTGLMCEDGGYYGNSTSTDCNLTLPDDFTELGDKLHIGDGTRQWLVEVKVDNAITFSDDELIYGSSGGNDYDTIKDALHMWTTSKTKLSKRITKDQICLGSFALGLHADDIQITQAITTTLKDMYDDLYTEHESDGTHKDNIIDNSNLKKDTVMVTQAFINRVLNGAFNINLLPNIDYWIAVGTPTLFQAYDNGKGSFPRFECRLTTDADTEGMRQPLEDVGFDALVPIRLSFYAKGNAGGEKLKWQLYNGVDSATGTATLTTTWTKYYLTLTPSDINGLTVRIASNQASTQTVKIALVTVCNGDIHTMPERSPVDAVLDDVKIMTFFCSSCYGSDKTFAKFILERAIKILNAYVLLGTAVAGDLTIRLSNGTTDYDVTLGDTDTEMENTADQVYAKGATMTVESIGSSATNGRDMIVVYQYRIDPTP